MPTATEYSTSNTASFVPLTLQESEWRDSDIDLSEYVSDMSNVANACSLSRRWSHSVSCAALLSVVGVGTAGAYAPKWTSTPSAVKQPDTSAVCVDCDKVLADKTSWRALTEWVRYLSAKVGRQDLAHPADVADFLAQNGIGHAFETYLTAVKEMFSSIVDTVISVDGHPEYEGVEWVTVTVQLSSSPEDAEIEYDRFVDRTIDNISVEDSRLFRLSMDLV